MATTTTPTTPVETTEPAPTTTLCRACSDSSGRNLENIDAYIQERVAAAINAEMALKKKESEKKPAPQVLQFKDAVGRRFSFPFYMANRWAGGMEDLIMQAFENMNLYNELVRAGYYDLVSEDAVIPRENWEKIVKPGILVTMYMWPLGKLRSELRAPPPEVVVPKGTRPPSPGLRSDTRSWVIKDCDDGVEEEEEEEKPKTWKKSRFRRFIEWMKEVTSSSGYNDAHA
ncbi:hypothetical protein QBC39DRAFT_60279 [Podospora conica]|nr:hypothetical protein QBC39DRAFT_60279 [Schizothecium conicum]